MRDYRLYISSWLFLLLKKGFRFLPDKIYLSIMFFIWTGKRLHLDDPKTFSEKLQWLKLYDRKPVYALMVDKFEVKKIVAEIIGKEYIIPTLGVWDSVPEIDWESLPDQFVIKCTHDSGSVLICKNKATFDIEDAKRRLEIWIKRDYFRNGREWPYKNVPHRIIAEEYIQPDLITNDLPDYKFFCFNGKPKLCQVISGRSQKEVIDFFDSNWEHQPFHEPWYFSFAEAMPQRPVNFEKMWNLAEKLAVDKPFARIDFYDVNSRVYFGEITFFPTSGVGGFSPKEWDEVLGEWIQLPSHKLTD